MLYDKILEQTILKDDRCPEQVKAVMRDKNAAMISKKQLFQPITYSFIFVKTLPRHGLRNHLRPTFARGQKTYNYKNLE